MKSVEPVPRETRVTGAWTWLEAASSVLAPDEREAVLGDLIEAGEGVWRATLAVLGLVLRREVLLWGMWRPWIAAFGLSLPSSFLLMGTSLSVTRALLTIVAPSHGPVGHSLGLPWLSVIPQTLLLLGWSWTAGFVVSTISRRTLWVSILACLVPCLFCLSRFQAESLPPYCLFLFLLPAVWGAGDGVRIGRIKRASAMLLAVAVTLLTVPTLHLRGEPWWTPPRYLIAATLTWPAWYLAVISTKARHSPGTRRLARCTQAEETR